MLKIKQYQFMILGVKLLLDLIFYLIGLVILLVL